MYGSWIHHFSPLPLSNPCIIGISKWRKVFKQTIKHQGHPYFGYQFYCITLNGSKSYRWWGLRERAEICGRMTLVSWPVAAFTVGIKNKPCLTMLLVCDSIDAVPESISVICHRVEAICFASTESTAFRTSTRASTTTPTSWRSSYWFRR